MREWSGVGWRWGERVLSRGGRRPSAVGVPSSCPAGGAAVAALHGCSARCERTRSGVTVC